MQTELSKKSLQLGILGLGLLQDGDVRVGVFPECEEILARSARAADAHQEEG